MQTDQRRRRRSSCCFDCPGQGTPPPCEIPLSGGFADLQHFCTTFTQVVARSPAAWRRNAQCIHSAATDRLKLRTKSSVLDLPVRRQTDLLKSVRHCCLYTFSHSHVYQR